MLVISSALRSYYITLSVVPTSFNQLLTLATPLFTDDVTGTVTINELCLNLAWRCCLPLQITRISFSPHPPKHKAPHPHNHTVLRH